MRSLLITAALFLAAGTAAASSIENVASGKAVNSSVATIQCPQCPPLQPKKSSSYVVPTLEPGTDRVEFKEFDGEIKSVRTEAWLGGSPVVFVTKASDEAIKAAAMKADPVALAHAPNATSLSPAVDETVKTSALGISGAEPIGASMAGTTSRKFDPSGFALRLN